MLRCCSVDNEAWLLRLRILKAAAEPPNVEKMHINDANNQYDFIISELIFMTPPHRSCSFIFVLRFACIFCTMTRGRKAHSAHAHKKSCLSHFCQVVPPQRHPSHLEHTPINSKNGRNYIALTFVIIYAVITTSYHYLFLFHCLFSHSGY